MNIEEQTDSFTLSTDALARSSINSGQARQLQFFTTPELTQCLDLISNLVENTKLIPLIKGQEGSGKTTLLFQLQSHLPEHWMLCRIDANPMMHPEQLCSRLAQHFGITEKNDLITQELLTHFESLRHEGILPIIAIDDAHLLPTDTVLELLQLHTSSSPQYDQLLHTILFATPAIDALLQTQDIHTINTQVIQTLDMPSLSPEQAASYITQVLIARGALEAFALTPDQINKLAQSSHGLPGHIETLLAKLPAHPAAPQKSTNRPAFRLLLEDLPITAIIGSLGLISIILLLLLFQDDINAFFAETSSISVHTKNSEMGKQAKIPLEVPEVSNTKIVLDKTKEISHQITPVEELEPILEAPEQSTTIAPPIDTAVTQPKISKQKTIIPKAATKAQIQEIPTTPKSSTASEKLPAGTISKPIAVKKPTPDATKSPNNIPKTVKKGPKREAWLLSQKPTTYTLQIVGLRNEADIEAFIKQHKLQGSVAYFKTSHAGRPWLPLLYGVYPDKHAATAARSKLSSQLNLKDIWARSLGSVHKEIKAKKQ